MGGEGARREDYRRMQLHFEELMLKSKAHIYRDADQSQYSHFVLREY